MTNIDLLNLFESKLDFKLGEEQKSVLLSIFKFISKPGFDTAVIKGSAGTGKSTISKVMIDYLNYIKIPFILSAPTNKASIILSRYTGEDSTTLHKLLTLRPNLNILELDYNDLIFNITDPDLCVFPTKGVVIIDECSMINKAIYTFIIEQAELVGCKVIFQGDPKQLSPVKEEEISKSFTCSNIFELTKIYRQQNDSPILDVLLELRDKPIYKFKEVESKQGSLKIYNHWRPFIEDNAHKFKIYDIKLIAYTNKRISAFNKVIRENIYTNPAEYEVGDVLTGYDTCTRNRQQVMINSEEYVVSAVVKTTITIGKCKLKAFNLIISLRYGETSLTSDNISITVLSNDNDSKNLARVAEYIENLRLFAIRAKKNKSKAWRMYFSVMETFLTPFDLKHNERTVRKKSLDYGYCITAHKSQSSTYSEILVDIGNINTCSDLEVLRQLQYVALSRTKNNIFILT